MTQSNPPIEPFSFSQFIQSRTTRWYWTVNIATVLALLVILTIDEGSPFLAIRVSIVSVWITICPGYSVLKAMYPENGEDSSPSLDIIERLALSFAISIALSPLISMGLNYTPWKIRGLPLTIILCCVTLFTAIVGLVREYLKQSRNVIVNYQS